MRALDTIWSHLKLKYIFVAFFFVLFCRETIQDLSSCEEDEPVLTTSELLDQLGLNDYQDIFKTEKIDMDTLVSDAILFKMADPAICRGGYDHFSF